MKEIKIHAFDLGDVHVDQSFVTGRMGMGTKVLGKYGCYYVEADGRKIMVDTGPAAPRPSHTSQEFLLLSSPNH